MTCPTPETLIPYALGAGDPAVAEHVSGCPACQAEVARVREAAGALRSTGMLDRRVETSACLDESTIADFVEGRLDARARAPVVAHLLTCAGCRSVVRAAGRAIADVTATPAITRRPWRRWSLPLGLAAAAALAVLLWPRSTDDAGVPPRLREPTDTDSLARPPRGPRNFVVRADSPAPMPIAPRASVARVDWFVWSSVPRAGRYRLRLYNDEGDVLWTTETADTLVAVPDTIALAPRVTYFWKVEAQTEWRQWAASDLVEFRLGGPSR